MATPEDAGKITFAGVYSCGCRFETSNSSFPMTCPKHGVPMLSSVTTYSVDSAEIPKGFKLDSIEAK